MERVTSLTFFYFLIHVSIFLRVATTEDTISPTKSLTDDETLVSSGQTFELGFFSPGKSSYRYLGIWFKATPDIVVWVANRDNPLINSTGELTISNTTNQLVVLNSSKSVVWSSNASQRGAQNLVAQLLVSGNLVLKEEDSVSSELYIWQSFDYPSDTLLAGMKFGWDLKTGLDRYLTSWKSVDDPSTGDYTFRLRNQGLLQYVLTAGSTTKFRSGTWNGLRFSGRDVLTDTIFKSIFVFNENESYYMFEPIVNTVSVRLVLNQSGSQQCLTLQRGSTQWAIMYSLPYQQCDVYGYCGANGICKVNKDPVCDCLEGFSPQSKEEWQVLIWANGCKRSVPLDCQRGEGFVKVSGVKLPDLLEFRLDKNMSLGECKTACLKNCNCTAYANSDVRNEGSGCVMWFGDLIDVREIHVKGSDQDMYIRLSASEIKSINDANKKRRLKIILVVATILGSCILALAIFFIAWKPRRKEKGDNRNEDIESPLFDLAIIATATDNFSQANMIGKGGFGPVYKGTLSTGQEIAVKRLSKTSGQGLDEFKNEVVLIAKLQHRNLVGLLGCCIHGNERMLVYEYMSNRSLDRFIFGQNRASLDWEAWFNIIIGIARGLLYLHQDSKLQIIHRDLKASNVLLDSKMNPKISDFGLARIFGGGESETTTDKVVGTYGYISPEYAVDGKFSVKSDVFSFGVVLLEIISGQRNRGFSHSNHHHNLLGHAWLLWNEDKALQLIDAHIKNSCNESPIVRCIHVGLLCVQKFPADRPTMASVVFMLANEQAELPWPKQPAFFVERSSNAEDPISTKFESYTNDDTTITILEGR